MTYFVELLEVSVWRAILTKIRTKFIISLKLDIDIGEIT